MHATTFESLIRLERDGFVERRSPRVHLLYDGEAEGHDERIPQVLRARGFGRSGARWRKTVSGVLIAVDLLAPPSAADLPTEMTRAAARAAGSEGEVGARIEAIAREDASGFVARVLGMG